MAVDKLVDSTQLDTDLTSVADAIRAKSGGSGQLAFPAGFVSEIGNISGGGGSATLIEKSVNANGTYNASGDSADGYSKVVVSVPASAVDSGTKSINANGTHDVTGYASASVNVPNSYAAGDDGKVVSNGALVSQTAHAEVTQNGTIDTTLNNSVTVNVSGSIANGIVITAKDSNGWPTALDIYGDLWPYALSYKGAGGIGSLSFQKTTSVRLMSNQTALTEGCFRYVPLETIDGLANITTIAAHVLRGTKLTSLSLPLVTKIDYETPFSNMTLLETVNIPLATGGMSGGTNSVFQNDTALETVVLGSVGHGLYRSSSTANNAFSGCTQSGLTITVYARYGSDVDNLVTAVRNGATNATIIIKASANTTYNNVSYNAGDTLITSTP